MKTFQEFCDSLDQEFIDSLSEETSYVLNTKPNPENVLMATSFAIAMRILERYHEWVYSESSSKNP